MQSLPSPWTSILPGFDPIQTAHLIYLKPHIQSGQVTEWPFTHSPHLMFLLYLLQTGRISG